MKQCVIPFIAALALSCASLEVHIQSDHTGTAPQKVLIGDFEKRTYEHSPFVVRNFRDSLKFAFIRLGYAAELLNPEDGKNSGEQPRTLNSDSVREQARLRAADMFIQGALFEASIGDAVDVKTSTSITLTLYDRQGKQFGEAQYICSETLANAGTVRDIASSLARGIDAKLKK